MKQNIENTDNKSDTSEVLGSTETLMAKFLSGGPQTRSKKMNWQEMAQELYTLNQKLTEEMNEVKTNSQLKLEEINKELQVLKEKFDKDRESWEVQLSQLKFEKDQIRLERDEEHKKLNEVMSKLNNKVIEAEFLMKNKQEEMKHNELEIEFLKGKLDEFRNDNSKLSLKTKQLETEFQDLKSKNDYTIQLLENRRLESILNENEELRNNQFIGSLEQSSPAIGTSSRKISDMESYKHKVKWKDEEMSIIQAKQVQDDSFITKLHELQETVDKMKEKDTTKSANKAQLPTYSGKTNENLRNWIFLVETRFDTDNILPAKQIDLHLDGCRRK